MIEKIALAGSRGRPEATVVSLEGREGGEALTQSRERAKVCNFSTTFRWLFPTAGRTAQCRLVGIHVSRGISARPGCALFHLQSAMRPADAALQYEAPGRLYGVDGEEWEHFFCGRRSASRVLSAPGQVVAPVIRLTGNCDCDSCGRGSCTRAHRQVGFVAGALAGIWVQGSGRRGVVFRDVDVGRVCSSKRQLECTPPGRPSRNLSHAICPLLPPSLSFPGPPPATVCSRSCLVGVL